MKAPPGLRTLPGMEQLAPARPDDAAEIAALLTACGLPSRDIAAHLPHFTVARDGGRLVGVIGLEVHGAIGLLRSLAVDEDRRGEGIALRLYAAELAVARRAGMERLFCLTTSAQRFFEMLGFRALPRDAVPEAIRDTEEYRTLCPATATCMVRPMPHD